MIINGDSTEELKNLLVLDDNLTALKNTPAESIDLIYLDPPFFSGRDYNVIWGDKGEVRSFSDRWGDGSEKTGLEIYIAWMEERVREMHRVLKPTGSFYLHCDWHASHYLKVLCDRVFGYGNFRNEIVWKRTNSPKAQSKTYGAQHDVILLYSKTDVCVFNSVSRRVEESEEIPAHYNQRDEKGLFCTVALVAGGVQKSTGRKSFVFKGIDAQWLYSKENLEKIEAQGLLYETNTGGLRMKRYWDGKATLSTLWVDSEVAPLQGSGKEGVGYPTQKPLALLERIIKASSNPGDIVLDPFCGGGTTLVAAAKNNRHYIGIDESVAAIRVSQERLKDHQGMFEDKYPVVLGLPHAFDDFNALRSRNPRAVPDEHQ